MLSSCHQMIARQLVWATLNQLSSVVLQSFPLAVKNYAFELCLELCVAFTLDVEQTMHTSRFFQPCKGHNPKTSS